MERGATRFDLGFDGTGPVAAVLRAIVRGEDLEFGDGFEVGINIEGGVAAVVHIVATVELPVVVLGATAIHAESHIAVDTDFAIVIASLVDHARGEGNELGKIAAV